MRLGSPIYSLDFEKPLVELERQIEEIRRFAAEKNLDMSDEVTRLQAKADQISRDIYTNLTPWQRIQIARHPKRPTFLDYAGIIFKDFMEIHGDRSFRDDPAMIGGLAYLEDIPVTVIGSQKGRDTKENIARNFGMPHPEGYRKALRLMEQAAKFGRPIITLVDVEGAYPGMEAEERGQGEAVARNIKLMGALGVPIIVVVTGAGGSGGALAIGVGDRVLILENAYYSVITPEGCASILWKDAGRAPEAATTLKITGQDLLNLGIVEEVITEPLGGAHKDPQVMAENMKNALLRNLRPLMALDKDQLLQRRYEKFRSVGFFSEK